MITSTEIRQQFLDFFKSKAHVIVPSAPIVVKNDPTLMFTNAGMNQFKDYFLGNKQAIHKRVADTQKCLRVSGKHNDLEEVGVDTFHHTMFEMLGNWSFGDYFKKEAIEWSWELLTKVYGIDKDKLYITVFGGDEKEKLPKDDEAITEWKRWIPEDRILSFGKKDNFWEMGDTGPCGPCTEIHVDCRSDEERKKVDGKTLVNADHPQVIEIWNVVFIQYNRLKDGSLEPLPAKHVDTGMGLERLVRVLQNKTSNYDTDIFTGVIEETEKLTGKKYTNADSKQDIAFRVFADHIRAIGFTIADGQLPSNTGAGYVIRRILRRAVSYYFSYLDYKQPLLCQVIPLLAHQFEKVFPELQKQVDFISKVVKEEEEAFLRTLDKGLIRFGMFASLDVHENLEKKGKEALLIPGEFAFELYDTYGFPLDLTKLIAKENGLIVDEKGFEKEMKKQKDRSRAATVIDTEDWKILDESTQNTFVGYDKLETETKVLKYRKVKAKGKESYQLVLETTPFYAESGGQVGDTGKLIINNEELIVNDTKKENDLIIHFVDKLPSDLSGKVVAKVDAMKRRNTAWHHSATHLLHAALRKVLGTHVTQKGSLVNAEHLRFDFSHFAKMTDEEIAEVEELVNEKIRDNISVVIKLMPKEEALKLDAMALFGEKYGDVVRVVIIDPTYSIELCGGTHVGATGDIGFFKIKNETAVAAGVRRIEAVCGKLADEYVDEEFKTLNAIIEKLGIKGDIIKNVEKFVEERNYLQKVLNKIETSESQKIISDFLNKNITSFRDIKVVSGIFECNSIEVFNSVFGSLRAKINDSIIILGATIYDQNVFRYFLNTKNENYKGNIHLKTLSDQYLSKIVHGVVQGSDIILNAQGKFEVDIKKVIDDVKNSTFESIKTIESFDDFWNNTKK
jgi:alanyl-tRNA synthetase